MAANSVIISFIKKTKAPTVFYQYRLPLIATALLFGCMSCNPMAETGQDPGIEVTKSGPKWPLGAMVTAANPHAVDAAIAILAKGGSAIDAAAVTYGGINRVQNGKISAPDTAVMADRLKDGGWYWVLGGIPTASTGTRSRR